MLKIVYSVEGLRGIAALCVALMHTWDNDVRQLALIKNSWLFVDLFFVISGYVITRRYAFKTLDVRSFTIRRLGRLFPLHAVMLVSYFVIQYLPSLTKAGLIYFGFGYLFSTPLFIHPPDWQSLIMGLTFTDIFGWHHHWLNNPHWSVSAEIWTYAVFIAVMMLPGQRWKAFSLVSLLAAVVLFTRSPDAANVAVNGMYVAISGEVTSNPWSLVRSVFGFFLGGVVACAPRLRAAVMLQPIFLVATLASIIWAEQFGRATFAQVFIFALLIWSLSDDNGPVAKVLGTKPLRKLGEWSYSIYISHAVILLVFWPLAYKLGDKFQNILLIPYLAILLVMAVISHRWIEEPWRNRAKAYSSVKPKLTPITT